MSIGAALLLGCSGDSEPDIAGQTCVDPTPRQVTLPGGTFQMGSTRGYADERPLRSVEIAPFAIDAFELTNAEFAVFTDATGYVTEAEQQGEAAVFREPSALRPNWWSLTPNANWRTPTGADSDLTDKEHYPVTLITRTDAQAYATWAGLRLPTEAEWEYAAKAGRDAMDIAEPNAANSWQGAFPLQNTGDDGHTGLARVGCYPANPFGLHDMVGNAWELTSTDHAQTGFSVIKGGSFLCAPNYCRRSRPAAREAQELGLGASHVGVRFVRDLDEAD